MYRTFCLLLFLVVFQLSLEAQQPATTDDKSGKVRIEWANQLEYHREAGREIQVLRGDVRISHQGAFLFCQNAEVVDEKEVKARGEVVIVQGDSLNVFADSLFYSAQTEKADLWANVVLRHNSEKLFTDSLHYDLGRRIAYYQHGALLTNDTTQLSSLRGEYYVDRDEALFRDSVLVVDPEFELKAEELRFNTRSRMVLFEGPTLISLGEDRSSRIYCEDGYYDLSDNRAEFAERPQYQNEDIRATARLIRYEGKKAEIVLLGEARIVSEDLKAMADTIRYDERNDVFYLEGDAFYKDEVRSVRADRIVYDRSREIYTTEGASVIAESPTILRASRTAYDEETGLAIASGGVVWQDTSAGLTIVCREAAYLEEEGEMKTYGGYQYGRPLLIVEMGDDSLYLSADTLFAHRVDTSLTDSSRVLHAYRDVRIFSNDLQASCDSLVYYEGDSLFRFFQQPVLWFDTIQLTADTMEVRLKEQEVHQMRLWPNAFIAQSSDLLLFNQVSGRLVDVFFEDNEPRAVFVSGNVESLYYLQDEKGAYIGLNQSSSSEMRILFEHRQVSRVYSLREIEGKVLPMEQAIGLHLAGFDWQQERRPLSLEDILRVTKLQ